MQRPRLLCIGPLPPVTHGQSEAFDIFIGSVNSREAFNISVINLNFVNKHFLEKIIVLSWKYLLFRIALLMRKPNAVYISFGRGKRSFQRDRLFLKIILRNNIPVIAHYHGGDMPILLEQLQQRNQNRILKEVKNIFQKIARVIVLSKNLTSDVLEFVTLDKIRVISNCFRIPPNFNLPEVEVMSEGKNKGVEILFLSNVIAEKGFFEVLSSIRILKNRGCDVHLTFVGSFISDAEHTAQELKKKTIRLIEEYKITDLVDIKGPLYGRQKWNEYIKADIFVLPTYYKTEGLPMSIIEAMAAGCAVITTPYRGIVDLLSDGIEGLFVHQRDSDDLADKIESLCRDSLKLNTMKQAAQKKARSKFSEDKYVTSIIEVIKEVV